ncbi:hypothetical protein HMPREF9075_00773 [Capnocytophaga sp. oral taxon 332 str. F0381]|nr:hypothetical protein HMPREF9075_00773 [Capnocytophaga sp. oral taxon 332 str. F0381]
MKMMTYNKTATLNHPIAKSYPSCLKDLDMIILTNDNQLKTKTNYFLEVITIDLDAVQEEIAIRDKKDKDSSTDTFFIAIDTKKKSKCILVELKLNVENPYNYFNKNKNREDLRKKIIDSITLLGKTISIHQEYFFIFKLYNPKGSPVLDIAKRILFNIAQQNHQNYIALSLEELKQRFFN